MNGSPKGPIKNDTQKISIVSKKEEKKKLSVAST